MPKCYNCPEHENVVAGKYKRLPWKRTPCAKCTLSDEPTHKGRSHVSRDSSDAVAAEEALHAIVQPEQMDDARIEKLTGFINAFMSLSTPTRDIVAFKLVHPDKPLRAIAVQCTITVQAAHSRLRRALSDLPVLARVIRMRRNKKGGGND
jgi:hypothetical protein